MCDFSKNISFSFLPYGLRRNKALAVALIFLTTMRLRPTITIICPSESDSSRILLKLVSSLSTIKFHNQIFNYRNAHYRNVHFDNAKM
jgi:hypothetical protein